MGGKRGKGKQKKRGGPPQRAPAKSNQPSSSSRSRSPQSGQSGSNYDDQQPGTSGLNDPPPVSMLEAFNNTLNMDFVYTLMNDISPALLMIDRDAGRVDHRPLITGLMDRIDNGLEELQRGDPHSRNAQSVKHRLTLHDIRVHLNSTLESYEDFIRRGARPAEDDEENPESDVEDEAGPSGYKEPSDDTDPDEPGSSGCYASLDEPGPSGCSSSLDEPGPSNR